MATSSATTGAATVTHTAAGGGYDGVLRCAEVAVAVTNDDTAGVTVSESALTIAGERRRHLDAVGAGQAVAVRPGDGDPGRAGGGSGPGPPARRP